MDVTLTNQQSSQPIDRDTLLSAVRSVLADSTYSSGFVNVAIVDDPTIHELNRRHLNHDYPTDILSFPLHQEDQHLEGELVVSADTAASAAAEYDWSAAEELLLYVIHGALHLVGYDDKTAADVEQMRAAESRYLARCGVPPPDGRSVTLSRNTEDALPGAVTNCSSSTSGQTLPGSSMTQEDGETS